MKTQIELSQMKWNQLVKSYTQLKTHGMESKQIFKAFTSFCSRIFCFCFIGKYWSVNILANSLVI